MKIQISESMGRPRSMMVRFVEGIQDTIQEHIWKIAAYSDVRKTSVNAWTTSISKHIPKLRLLNVPEKGGSANVGREYLERHFIHQLFSKADLEVLNHNWSTLPHKPYPKVEITDELQERCIHLGKMLVDSILDRKEFRP